MQKYPPYQIHLVVTKLLSRKKISQQENFAIFLLIEIFLFSYFQIKPPFPYTETKNGFVLQIN